MHRIAAEASLADPSFLREIPAAFLGGSAAAPSVC